MGILAGMGTRSAGARDLLSTGYELQVYATLRRVLVNAGVLSVGVAGNWKGCLDQGPGAGGGFSACQRGVGRMTSARP